MGIQKYLEEATGKGASDLFIVAGLPLTYKINRKMVRVGERLMPEDTRKLIEDIYSIAQERNIETLEKGGDDDFSFSIPNLGRFRVSTYRQRGSLAAVIRLIAFQLPNPEELSIPPQIMQLAEYRKGLVLVTGSAGSGKSTTLACLIDQINSTREEHIITLEDPLEFLHRHKKSIVSQREVSSDTDSYKVALRASLRQSPDVILLGEMRDYETINIAMTAAETGHLVFSTLHTLGAANAVDRIIDVFPANQQRQIIIQLASVLNAVVSQQLLPDKEGKLIPAFEVVVSRNKVKIDLGTLTDEYEKEITIHTTATDKITGEKVIVAGKKVTIVDTVTLDGLEEGRKYQLKGWQMLKEENAELLIDGKRVESDYTFVADSEKMKVEISYTFDASELGGQNLVTFEELYDLKNSEEPVKVAEHKDIDDEGQTVLITERKISIHTTATDKNGKKEIEAGKDLTIVDTVTLEGLEIGTKYKLSGWQMIKEENAKLIIDGKEVTNDYEFIADKENMEVQIEFTFDGSTLGGKQLVTFEELYDMTNPEEPKKVTEHKDINDEGQTVTIKEIPETPTPETPGTTTKTSNPPKTGDTTKAGLWLAIAALSAMGVGGVAIHARKKKKAPLAIEEKKEESEDE